MVLVITIVKSVFTFFVAHALITIPGNWTDTNGQTSMNGRWETIAVDRDANGNIISISYKCHPADQLCWRIISANLETFEANDGLANPNWATPANGVLTNQ